MSVGSCDTVLQYNSQQREPTESLEIICSLCFSLLLDICAKSHTVSGKPDGGHNTVLPEPLFQRQYIIYDACIRLIELASTPLIDHEDDYDFQNFVSVAAAAECVCVGFSLTNIDQLFLGSSAGCRQNSYAERCVTFAVEGCVCVCTMCVCLREVGCSFVEATYVPSVQEMKQRG